MTEVILCQEVGKSFRSQGGGVRPKSLHFWQRTPYEDKAAVEGLSFRVTAGERIALIGPNGAGKSTTIKLLTGILEASTGHIAVLHLQPYRDRLRLTRQIGTVFGQRSQLWYHLAARQTFELLRHIYDLPLNRFRERLKELSELFEIEGLVDRPVSQLSLGQRMRCEVVASLLHRPSVVFLDEPTIGLDIHAKAAMRHLLLEQSQQDGTTVLLTSHDTGDIESVCERVMLIDQGRLLIDESLAVLKAKHFRHKLLKVRSQESTFKLDTPGIQIVKRQPFACEILVDSQLLPIDQAIHIVLGACHVQDLSVSDSPLEEIIKTLYSGKVPHG